MSTVSVIPNATPIEPDIAWTIVGGAATKQAAVTDANDATRVRSAASGSASKTIEFPCGPASLPDGAAITSLTPVARVAGSALMYALVSARRADGSAAIVSSDVYFTAPASPATYTRAAAGAYNEPAVGNTAKDVADRIRAYFSVSPTGVGDVVESRIDIVYTQAPSATAAGVTGATTTTTPTVTWTISSPDGAAQDSYTGVVWATADQAAFPSGQAGMEASQDYLFCTASTPPAGVAAMGVDSQGPYFTIGTTVYRAKAWTVSTATGLPGSQAGATGSWPLAQTMPIAGAMKAYVRSQGTYANQPLQRRTAAGLGSVAFTMAVPVPAAPTSITPVWQYPGAVTPNNVGEYRMKIDVVLPTDVAARQVKVERSAGDGRWALLPVGAIVTATTAAQTLTFYDTAASPGRGMVYRVSMGSVTVNAWGNPVSSAAVTAIFDQFVLRNPLQLTGAVVLHLQGDLESTSDEVVGFSRGLGTAYPIGLSDAIQARRYAIELMTFSETEQKALRALRVQRTTLLLQGDMAGWYRWIRFGESWSNTLVRQISRRFEALRVRRIRTELVETWPVPGQPLSSDWG